MKVFVTGGAGYVGSVCVEELISAGHEVVVWDSLIEGHRAAIAPRAQFVQGDLLDREHLTRTLTETKPEAIMHFAAATLVPESMTNPGKSFLVNIGGGVNLLDAAVNAGVKKFVFSSTCAIFGVPNVEYLTEDLTKGPISPYGESKWMFERVLEWYRQLRGIQYVCLRYFNASGATARCGEHHRQETHLIPIVLQVPLGQRSEVKVYGTDYPTPDGTCIRDYIHVLDLANGHVRALTHGQSDVFNLGSGNGYSVREVIESARRVTGHPIPVIETERRAGDPPRLVADSSKIRSVLGWQPKFDSLDTIVASAWQWHQTHPQGYAEV